MPRFRNISSGVVVDVDEDTGTRLGAGYEPVKAPESKPAPRRRSTKPDDD